MKQIYFRPKELQLIFDERPKELLKFQETPTAYSQQESQQVSVIFFGFGEKANMSASVPAPPPWYWQNDAGEWCQYESKVCAALEEVRRLGPLAPSTVIKLSDISSSHRLARYSVEVPAMIQENTRSGKRRVFELVVPCGFM